MSIETGPSTRVELKRAVQIGIVVRDLERTTKLLTCLFGIEPFTFIEWPRAFP